MLVQSKTEGGARSSVEKWVIGTQHADLIALWMQLRRRSESVNGVELTSRCFSRHSLPLLSDSSGLFATVRHLLSSQGTSPPPSSHYFVHFSFFALFCECTIIIIFFFSPFYYYYFFFVVDFRFALFV